MMTFEAETHRDAGENIYRYERYATNDAGSTYTVDVVTAPKFAMDSKSKQ